MCHLANRPVFYSRAVYSARVVSAAAKGQYFDDIDAVPVRTEAVLARIGNKRADAFLNPPVTGFHDVSFILMGIGILVEAAGTLSVVGFPMGITQYHHRVVAGRDNKKRARTDEKN